MIQEKKKIKVLIVDDSILYRELLLKGISTDPNIEIVATAVDSFDARDKIIEYSPDVITCDVEMPKMSGIDFIKKIMPQFNLPVIIISSINSSLFDAMNAGAIDFVIKPDINSLASVKSFINDVISKVKTAFISKVLPSQNVDTAAKITSSTNIFDNKIIAIGASTGGTVAIFDLLKMLPKNTPGIVIVQHIPPIFSRMFAERLNAQTDLIVKEAETGDFIESGHVLIAPGDQHIKIKKVGKKYQVQCYMNEKVNGYRPSVDVLFESVAVEAGNQAVGIILTGMGYDGAKGLLSMKRKGARTIGQDEASSAIYGMPKVAFNVGAVEVQSPLKGIPKILFSLLCEA